MGGEGGGQVVEEGVNGNRCQMLIYEYDSHTQTVKAPGGVEEEVG
jgi:hypothetical protein